MKYKAILFDVDDTLLDSISARVGTLQRVFTSAGITNLDAERYLRDLQGSSLEAALARLAGERGISVNLFLDYRRIYWSKGTGMLKLYAGVREVLEKLHKSGLKLGVVTTKLGSIEFEGAIIGAAKELGAVGVAHLFSALVGFENVTRYKPYPDGINLAMNRLAVAPDETLMVGDSAGDIGAAEAAGCWSCYATWGVPADERGSLFASATPDFVLDSPAELLEIVR